MALIQELADRLVAATEEQDVLFVLYWLNEMKEAGCLNEGIRGNHSWKGYSAITSIARNPPSPFRKIMLQILLLSGLEVDVKEIVQLGMMNLVSSVVVDMLFKWETSEKENAKYAKLLLSLPLEQAAHWLDRILPAALNASEFTGYSPPLPPPSTALYASAQSDCDYPDHFISVEDEENVSTAVYRLHPILFPPKPVLELESPRLYYSSQAQSYWIYPHPPPGFELVRSSTESGLRLRPLPRTLVHCPSWSDSSVNDSLIDPVQLGLARFPQNFTPFDLVSLFHGNGVRCKIFLMQASTSETYAAIEVEEDKVERCLKCLDGIKLEAGSRRLRCFVVEMEEMEEIDDGTMVRQCEWTGEIDEGLVPFPPSSTSPTPTSISGLTSIPTSTRKDLAAHVRSSRRRRDPPRSPRPAPRPPQPTAVIVSDLPLNVNDEPFKRFDPQSLKLLRYNDRKVAFAVLTFRGKRGAQRFIDRWNREEKKQPYERSQAKVLPTGVEDEEFVKNWLESPESEGTRERHKSTGPVRMSPLENKKRKLEESFIQPSFTFDHELFTSYDERDYES